MNDYELEIYIGNLAAHNEGKPAADWLRLPTTPEVMAQILKNIGVNRGGEIIITEYNADIPGLDRFLGEHPDLDELNYLAAAVRDLSPEDAQKFAAAVAHGEYAGSTKDLINLTRNLSNYDYFPAVKTEEDYGYFLVDNLNTLELPEAAKNYFMHEDYGRDTAINEGGIFTDGGYICNNRREPFREYYNGQDIPQEYRITPKPKQEREQAAPRVDMDAAATTAPAADAQTVTAAPFVLVSDNPRDKLKEITGKLEAGIKSIFESEQYKTYLKTLSKFHNYSMNNCLLIAFQKPDATHVAGFNAWRDDFKRPVMKGQKGIKIIAPSPFKARKEQDKIDAQTGRPVIGKNGKPIREEVEITVPAFKVATVFDVSQTDGEPLPQIGVDELTGSVDRYKEFFAALEKSAPFPIAFEKITSGAKGYCNYEEQRIAINEGMSELQNLKTAIHEITHARLHNVDKDLPKEQQPRVDQHTREVQAESVAYTVCQHYGLDTSDYSFGYVAAWSGDKELDVLKASLETIRKEADAIITEIDGHLAELQKSREQTAERTIEDAKQELGQEVQATLQMFIDADMKAHGAVTESTLEAIAVQGYEYKDGKLAEATAPISGGDAPEHGDSFTIYQLKDGDETRDIRFEPYNKLLAAGLVIDPANYDKTYSAPLDNSMTLDKLYFAFNMNRPEDFTGHSLSISDVIVLNKDGKETAFYVDSRGFQETPEFFKTAQERAQPAPPPFDLKPVAEYLQKIHDSAMNADPNKTQGVAAFNMAVKRLNQVNERLPETQPQLKALVARAAESTDIPTLRERMGTVKSEFIQHYTPNPEHTAAQPATKTEYGANVAAIEAQVKAGQAINLSDLADAIKSDKTAAPQKTEQTAKPTQTRQPSRGGTAKKSTPIHDDLKAGKQQLAKDKPAPQRTAAKGKNAGLGD